MAADPIRRSARQQGWRTTYFNERLVFGPLSTSAERLVELIDELDQTHDTIVVIGHSMGGLVVEHAAALGAPIDGLVTIELVPNIVEVRRWSPA
jgi:pimeloyl-ACP methyl ester carboxylesterase